MFRVFGPLSPVMRTTGVGVEPLLSRSRSSGPLRPGRRTSTMRQSTATVSASKSSADAKHVYVVAQAAEEPRECLPHALVVVDNRQRH